MSKRSTLLSVGSAGLPFYADPELGALSESIGRNRMLMVGIDVSKCFHSVLIVDFNGKPVGDPFEFNLLSSGYERFTAKVRQAQEKVNAGYVGFLMEPTGIYHLNLAEHIKQDFGSISFVNPLSVSRNREEHFFLRHKTDSVDTGSLADLGVRNVVYDYNIPSGVYATVSALAREYATLKNDRVSLTNRMTTILDELAPGLIASDPHHMVSPLFSDFWRCKTAIALLQMIIKYGIHALIRMDVDSFTTGMHDAGIRIHRDRAAQIKSRLCRILLPLDGGPDAELRGALDTNLGMLGIVEARMNVLTGKAGPLLETTPARHLLAIKGASVVNVLGYVGAVKDPAFFARHRQVWAAAGFKPSIYKSGKIRQKRPRINRAGRELLHGALLQLAMDLAHWCPFFGYYYERRLCSGATKKAAKVSLANKVNRVCFAIMRDDIPFDPGDEAEYSALAQRWHEMRDARAQREKKQRRVAPMPQRF